MIGYFYIVLLIVVLPLYIGNCICSYLDEKESNSYSMLYGWIIMFASFEIVAVPLILMKRTLSSLCIGYAIILIIIIIFCMIICVKNVKKRGKTINVKFDFTKAEILIVIVSCMIIFFQIGVVVFKTHMDADDTFYIGHAVTSIYTEKMYQINPYTGADLVNIPINYVLSPLSMFWAFLGKISGIHPAIIVHVVIPLLFIPIAYWCTYLLGCRLFHDSKQNAILFVLIYVVLQQFGYTSRYTASAFLLFRIWQGKAIVSNILLPCILLTADKYLNSRKVKGNFLLTIAVSLAACFCSSMGIILGLIETGILVMVYFIKSREKVVLLKGIWMCIPYFIFGTLYIFMKF